jgi:hypothetical protein
VAAPSPGRCQQQQGRQMTRLDPQDLMQRRLGAIVVAQGESYLRN